MPIPLGILAVAGAGAAGGGGSFDLLETTTLGTAAATVTFSGLGSYSAYKHLQLRVVARANNADTSSNGFLRVNGDTTSANYRHHALYGDGASVGSFSGTGPYIGEFVGNNATANIFTPKVIDVLDFSSSSKNTTFRTFWGNVEASTYRSGLYSHLWVNTNAVTSLEFYLGSGSFLAGSRFSIYGIK
jgi:hypothetical protein